MAQLNESSNAFVQQLTDSLKNNKLEDALGLFKDDKNNSLIGDSSWDVVPVICSYLTYENARCNKELVDCCEHILDIIAEKCNPLETVLDMLEQIESSDEDVKFCAILNSLSKSLKGTIDKGKTIEWCVSTIRSYVDGMPKEDQEASESEASQDVSSVESRIETVYSSIISFLEPLVDEAALKNDATGKNVLLRDYLTSILVFLLGKPLCSIGEQEAKSEKIISLIIRIKGDLLWFLRIIDTRNRKSNSEKTRSRKTDNYDLRTVLFELDENVSDLAYANFYFHILSKPYLWEKVPQVYCPVFVFQTCIYLVDKLLREQEHSMVVKGLSLAEELLKRIERYSLTMEALQLKSYLDLFNTIIQVMIYCDTDNERKRALHVFQEYIDVFNMEARYSILLHLYQTNNHSGFLSLITSKVKSSVVECLETTSPTSYFLGSHLKALLKQVCQLRHEPYPDLVDLSDEIITTLNFLRFLCIRDTSNETGIWDMISAIEEDYFKPLWKQLTRCRNCWLRKIYELEALQGDSNLDKCDTEIKLVVGKLLPPMSVSEKLALVGQAINILDMIESILIRVNECIRNKLPK